MKRTKRPIYNMLLSEGLNLWHITDRSNNSSIRRHGILSTKDLKDHQLFATFGGNDISLEADLLSGMNQFVHLSFTKKHPFAYTAAKSGTIKTPMWLEIDRRVLLEPGVRFTKGVSNRSGEPILDESTAAKSIDFDAIFKFTEDVDRWKEAQKAEILVPGLVPPHYIL